MRAVGQLLNRQRQLPGKKETSQNSQDRHNQTYPESLPAHIRHRSKGRGLILNRDYPEPRILIQFRRRVRAQHFDRVAIARRHERSERGLHLGARFLPILYHFQIRHRLFRESDTRIGVSYRTAILIDNKNHRQSRVQHFTFALGSDLMNSLENFLKGNDGHHGRDNVAIARATHDRNRNRERHFLT